MKPQLVDMIRTVPEVAVRLWCGAAVCNNGVAMKLKFEGSEIEIQPEIYFPALKVAQVLQIRFSGRMLKSINDLLELRHAAEDLFLEILFEKDELPRVLFVPAGVTASGYCRAMIPSDLMYEGGRCISHWTSSIDLSKAMRYDILWIQLITSPILIEIVKKAQQNGIRIVYDIDDRLDSVPVDNQAIAVYGDPAKQREILDMIRTADLVTVSTEPLAEHIRAQGAKEVRVLPNMLTTNVIPRRHPPNKKFTRILWAGSPTHKRDLAIVAPAIRDILKREAGKVRFTCFGERLPEALADCYDWIDLKDPVDYDQYHDTIATIAADFGIAPLERNAFNDSKSAIKALEYASAGYPMLLSPVGEYPEVVKAGMPAELVADDQWGPAIDRMIARTREERDAMGKACLKWTIENRCIGMTKASRWADVAVDLMERMPRPKVDESLKLVTG
jgi:glycosyltransferase involved in cell wall biosynthesis